MDDIEWESEPPPETLERVGGDLYRNTVTMATGALEELSTKPGAVWVAHWTKPPHRCTRLSDGTIYMEALPPNEVVAPDDPAAGHRGGIHVREGSPALVRQSPLDLAR